MIRRLYYRSRMAMLLLMPWFASAQTDTTHAIPRWMVKTNFSSLCNPAQQAFCAGVDMRLVKDWSADVMAGTFFNSVSLADEVGESYNGYRLMLGSNYSFKTSQNGSLLLGIEGKRNVITNTNWREVERQGGSYVEWMLIPRKIKVNSGMLRFGGAFYTGKHQQIAFELIGLAGWRRMFVTNQVPADGRVLRRPFNFDFALRPGTYDFIDMAFRFNIGYCFW